MVGRGGVVATVHVHTIGKGGRLFGTASFKYLAL